MASTVLDKGLQAGHSSPNLKGDKQRKQVTLAPQTRQSADQSVFHVYKGVKAFDFCKDTNILATGGKYYVVEIRSLGFTAVCWQVQFLVLLFTVFTEKLF